MGWESRLLSPAASGAAEEVVGGLIAQQIESWPMLREAVGRLAEARYREVLVGGESFRVQCNPGRIVSASAKVDAASISARPCFLCPSSLPPEERAIGFSERLVVLCNPYPIVPSHLVIADRQHRPQSIGGSFEDYLKVTEWLGERFFTLYNGARCGASAPDHLHFQAGAIDSVRVFDRLRSGGAGMQRRIISSGSGGYLVILPQHPVNLLVLESADRQWLGQRFRETIARLGEVTGEPDEPLLNLVATFRGGVWSVVIFPRHRHRPACYFAEEESRLTISPGAVDLAGLFVLPDPVHFERLRPEDLATVIDEVALDDARFAHWLDLLETVSGGEARQEGGER